jgi:DNA repair protein RecN (Recombination protein N)
MIRELHIRNLALIEELNVEFESGFTVFTGETGAGKSILIGAIGLLLGERASSEMIRNGFEEADVSGIFDISATKAPLSSILDELSIEPEENTLIIRRKISRNDRNRIHINQVPVPLVSLKKIGDFLIDFHGQHDHQSLLNEDAHILTIDNLPNVTEARMEYDRTFTTYSSACRALNEYESKARNLLERKEILEFQFKELKSLDLKINEEQELQSELSLLSSSAERVACVSDILDTLSSNSDSVEKRISLVLRKLETLAKYDNSIEPWIRDVENALNTFTELETFCGSYIDKAGTAVDPARLETINSRLARIQRLRKKYASTIEQLIEKQNSLKHDLDTLENIDADRNELQKNADCSRKSVLIAGAKLTSARKSAAQKFDNSITSKMSQLGFKNGKWLTDFIPGDQPSPDGMETARFLVQTNAGESLLSLSKTASGGEISRLMLAIKSVLAENDNISVLIFDEIDTGIGGLLASEVGKAMYHLSETHQVLCISHLHQIASIADNHFLVYKENVDNRTITFVKKLDYEQKVYEISRMMGGNSEISLQHARELLKKK